MDLNILTDEIDITLAATMLGLLLGLAPLAFFTRRFVRAGSRAMRRGLLLIGWGVLALALHEVMDLHARLSSAEPRASWGQALLLALAGALLASGIVAIGRAGPPRSEGA